MNTTLKYLLSLLALLPAALWAQDNNNKPTMNESEYLYILKWVKKVESPADTTDGKNSFMLRYEMQTEDRIIYINVARFTLQGNRYWIEDRCESEEYAWNNVGEDDEEWYTIHYPEEVPMLPEGYADENLLYADVLVEYWKGKPMPEEVAAWLVRLNWWAMRCPDEITCYEYPEICKYESYIVSGETAGWVTTCKKELERLGAKAVWNIEQKQYEVE